MMKSFIFIIILAFPFTLFSQNKPIYDLVWKIDSDEMIGYETVMDLVDTSIFSFKFGGMDTLMKTMMGLVDTEDALSSPEVMDTIKKNIDMDDFFAEMIEEQRSVSYFSLLTEDKKNDDLVNFKMIGYFKEGVKETFMTQARKGVQLRGKFYKNGGLESWYYQEGQRNLLTILMQLPEKPVTVGESWSIDCNFLTFDQSFSPDTISNSNKVTLVKVDTVNNDLIAVIQYDIHSFAEGTFSNPMFGNSKDGMANIDYQGFARFNITKGYWESYKCILHSKMNGLMSQESSTLFQMKRSDIVPKQVLKYK